MSGFFGFDTDVPSLGAGKFDDLDAALPDDEDIDIVNDETFGAGAVFDGDWEEAHEKLAEQLETFKYEGQGHHRNGQANHRYRDGPERSMQHEESFPQADTLTSQEDDLEKSLSQLVVDDDEIDDPAIMNLSKNRPIPQVPGYFIQAKNNNLDNLFGPSSPPAFLNTEHLVSPGKTNIWGSPVTRESYMDPTPPKDDGGIKNLLSMLKAKSPPQQVPFQDPSIVMASKPFTNVRSLDELEQELISGSSPVGPPPHLAGSGHKNGRPLTVEDLEREMRGQPIPTPPGGRPPHRGPAPIGTPPQGQFIQQHIQRMSNNNKTNAPYSTSPGQPFSSSPHAPGYSHSTAPITIAKRGTPPSSGFQANRCPSPVLAALMQGRDTVSQSPLPSAPTPIPRASGAPGLRLRISPTASLVVNQTPPILTPPSYTPSPMQVPHPMWVQSTPQPMSALAISQALQATTVGSGRNTPTPPSTSFRTHLAPTPPQMVSQSPRQLGPWPTALRSDTPTHMPPLSSLFPRRGTPTPPPYRSSPTTAISPAGQTLVSSCSTPTSGALYRTSPTLPLSSSCPPGLGRTSQSSYTSIRTRSSTDYPSTPGLINNSNLSPTEVKHRLAAALTAKILSASLNGTGSPVDRHGSKNVPSFMSNQPVQQRMPFPGGFNDNNRGGFNDNNRGGFNDNNRGGFNDNRGGFNENNRGGFNDNNRGGFNDNNRGGFNDNNRGGFNDKNRGRGPHHHQGPPPPRGHPMFNQNKPGFEPRFPNDRHPGDRFQNGRHAGDRFPPNDRYGPGPMDDRYGPGPMDDRYGPGPMDDRYGPGPGDRFPNGEFHGRHSGDHHMERGGRGFNHMDRGGRGFNNRGRGGMDGPMDHPGRGGFDMRMRGGPPDMRGGRGGFDMRGGRGRGGFHHPGMRWRNNSCGEEDEYEMGGGGDRDVFANLMSQKEKDWIIKIQLMQIHTNDPYLDDYYYTKWQMEKLIRERAAKAGSKGEPKLVLPQLAKADGRLYKPVQFEGSLGRLTASSVHNPRQIIDVKVKTNTGDEEGRHKEVRRFKQLLIHIEKSYDLLLVIDDVEKRAMALPEGARPPLYNERAVRIHELYDLLHLQTQEDISFVQLLTVRKGTKLVARTIPFLAKEQALTVIMAILQSILTVIKRDLQDEVMAQLFEPMAHVISELELAELVLLTDMLSTQVTETPCSTLLSFMLQSKFGASLVWSVVSRGEVIFRTVSPVDLDVANQNSWASFLHTLGEAATQAPELAQPFYVFPTVPAYLQEHLGRSTYSTLQERLALALAPTTHELAPSTPPVVQVAS